MSSKVFLINAFCALLALALGISGAYYMISHGWIVSSSSLTLPEAVKNFMITRTALAALWFVPTFLVAWLFLGWDELFEDYGLPVASFIKRTWPISYPAAVLFATQGMIWIAMLSMSTIENIKYIIQ